MPDQITVGDVYFRITYAERGRRYPLIESFVFVGKDLSDEDKEETWYFQFADSYGKHGSILETAGGDRRVARVARADLQEMLNDRELLKELQTARNRRAFGG